MSFLTTSTNVIFCLPLLFFFFSTWINPLFLTSKLVTLLWTWPNYLKRYSLIFSSIEATSIFKWIFSFQILSFCLIPLIYLNYRILVTLILWICCFLTTQHLVAFVVYTFLYFRLFWFLFPQSTIRLYFAIHCKF